MSVFIDSLIHSFFDSLSALLIHLFIYSFIDSGSFIDSWILSLSLIHSFSH